MGYLVLTRQGNESIHIGRNISVTVVKVRGGRVRLGIFAPDDVAVDRAEVAAAKLCEDRAPRTLRAKDMPNSPERRKLTRVPARSTAVRLVARQDSEHLGLQS